MKVSSRKKNRSSQKNAAADNSENTIIMDLDSPYSPGSNDYEDLFEPPPETTKVSNNTSKNQSSKSAGKSGNAFDSLFSASPIVRKSKPGKNKRPRGPSKGINGRISLQDVLMKYVWRYQTGRS